MLLLLIIASTELSLLIPNTSELCRVTVLPRNSNTLFTCHILSLAKVNEVTTFS